ncbi:hypothetical protein [Clostridium sp. CCUG 7971]|nr:hypothetical protein [Clostridium sp. CCUG 7971]
MNRDWKGEIESYDKGKEHIINFADILYDSIINQFPKKFQIVSK